MCSPEELEYDDKLERITEQMEELMLDIMIEALQSIKRKHNHIAELRRTSELDDPRF